MASGPLTAIRTGLDLFNDGEYEASIATLLPQIEWDTTDRDRAWREAGIELEP